jgi:hypothetical protein
MKSASMLVLALALASCGGSHHASATATPSGSNGAPHTTATSTSGEAPASGAQSLSVKLSAPRSEPEAGRLWPITVSARNSAGAPVTGTVSYAFVFGGSVVARRPGGTMRGGIFHDRLEFPARALDFPLSLEVIVKAAGQSGSVLRSVTVHG